MRLAGCALPAVSVPRRVGEDSDDNRAAFVRLAKDAFPGDPQIQRLR